MSKPRVKLILGEGTATGRLAPGGPEIQELPPKPCPNGEHQLKRWGPYYRRCIICDHCYPTDAPGGINPRSDEDDDQVSVG